VLESARFGLTGRIWTRRPGFLTVVEFPVGIFLSDSLSWSFPGLGCPSVVSLAHVLCDAVVAGLLVFQALGDSARATMVRAEAAVAGDSVSAVAGAWHARLAQDSTDRAAKLGLAALAALQHDTAEARRWVRTLVTPGHPPTDKFATHAMLVGVYLAKVSTDIQATIDAMTDAASAARALPDSETAVEALANLAVWRARQIGPRQALALLDTAANLIPRHADWLQARWRCKRAEVLALGAQPSAVTEAEAGAKLARSLGDAREEAICLAVAAEGELSRGNAAASLPLFRRSADLDRQVRDGVALAATLQWLGHAETETDYLAAARRDLAAAVTVGDSVGFESAVAWAWADLSRLSVSLGDLVTGSAALAHADSLFARQGDRVGMSLSRGARALIERLSGRYVEAAATYDTVVAEATQAGVLDQVLWARQSLAYLALIRGDVPRATSEMRAYQAVARQTGDSAAAQGRSYVFGAFALESGDLDRAQQVFERLLDRLDRRDYLNRYDAGVGLARVRLLRGDVTGAAASLDTATRALDDWRATLDERALRVQAYQEETFFGPVDRGVPTIIAGLAGTGQLDAAFALAERRRARDLVDALLRARTAASDSITAGEHQAATAVPVVELPAVEAALPDDSTAFIEYVVGVARQPTTAFVITRTGATAYILPTVDTLSGDISLFASLIEGGARARDLGRRLASAFLSPCLVGLSPSIHRLIIVPDGPLHRVPFDALVLADGRFVVEHYSVSEIPSITVALHLWSRPHRAPVSTLLAFGDPRFAVMGAHSSVTGDVYRDAFSANGGLPRLTASADEARRVALYASDAKVLLGADASESRLKQEPLARYGVVHFATHALVDETAATRTSLALAPGGGESGFVSPGELAALPFSADLVVLSGCRTAGGVVLRGEGLQGLTAPLLEAGVRSVVATRWRIADRQALSLMNAFYAEMARGQSVADALYEMKLGALRNGGVPAEWAAYTVVGDPFARPALQPPTIASRLRSLSASTWLVATAALAIGLALLYSALRWKGIGTVARVDPSAVVTRTNQ
jgi:CHAT domain-containing protein/tetratricopeptide (TPR) repeat protein